MSEGPGLVAQPKSDTTATTGFGILESAEGLATGVSSGDWVAAGLGGVGVGLEVLSMVVDPIGTLASAGVSWLIEHVQPLKEALDWLAGDPPVIRSFSETWGNVSAEVARIAQEMGNEAKNGTAGWTGASADAYRAHTAEVSDAIAGAGALADGISAGVMIMGEVVAFVRETVRDIVAELIGRLIAWALEAVCTLGLATPVIVGQAVTAISRVVKKIGDLIRNLIKTIGNVAPRIRKIIDKLDEIMQKLAKLMRKGGDGTTSPSGATTPSGASTPTKPRGGDGTTSPSSADGPSTHPSSVDAPPGKASDGTSPSSSSSPNGRSDTSPPGGRTDPASAPKGDNPPPRNADNGGQRSEGNGGCDGRGGDPVDTVSGQMIMSSVDLELPGLLPLVVSRSYASDYRDGRLFGPGWSSTLDQRLELTDDGVRFYGDDAQVLSYPRPQDEPVLPLFGARWPLTWDRATDTYLIEDPDSGWVRHFAAVTPQARPITALTGRDGHQITYTRDPSGQPVSIRHSGGYYVAVDIVEGPEGTRLGSLRLIDQQGQGVRVVAYQYDQLGRLTGVVNSTGVPYRYSYDAADRITSWTDRNGFSYSYEYRPDGRVSRGWNADGYLDATFDYDLGNRVTAVTDSLGHRTEYHYDEHNHITAVVDQNGNAERPEFDRYHQLVSFTDKNGNTTRYERDEHGEPVRVTYPDGAVVSYTYDPRWRLPISVTQSNGAVWRHTYDDAGHLVSTVDPMGAVVTNELDDRGHLAASVDADGARWTYTSDDAGRPTSITTPLGETTRFRHNGFGRVVEAVDARGRVTRYGWSVEGQPIWQVSWNGDREERFYDPEGNMVRSRSASGAVTTFEHGPFNTLLARTGQDGIRYTFRHDTELRLTGVTNPAGETWTYRYDPAGNLVGERDFTGRTLDYRVDAMGNLVARSEGGGPAVELVRDVRGRVLAQSAAGTRTDFEYGDGGWLRRVGDGVTEVTFERDLLGRPLAESVNGQTVRNEYDLAGRRVRRVSPSGVEASWRYDELRRETELVGTAGTVAFEYQAGQEVLRRLGENATLTQTYDARERLAGQALFSSTAVPGQVRAVQQRTFRYRADGQVTAIDDRLRGDRVYELTSGGRVTGVRATTWAERYAYDALGNLVAAQTGPSTEDSVEVDGPRTVNGVMLRAAGRTSYDYDAAGRVVREVRRTLSGQRRVREYEWNALNQLVAVTTPEGTRWRYVYDPFGRRIAKHRLGADGAVVEETTFAWDGMLLAEERRTVDGTTTATSWEYRPGRAEPVTQTTRSWLADAPAEIIDTRFHAIVADLIGTPTELVDAAGQVVWYRTNGLWGNTIAVSTSDGTSCPLRFPGQYHDVETGLHYNVHRYYDPHTARYLSPDPLGLPPSPNHYTYVANPLAVSDPLGLAGYRGDRGQWARDPDLPPPDHVHNRGTEYPRDYWQSTHDHMATHWTVEGRAARGVPVDANGARIPHDQLNWVNRRNEPIDYYAPDGRRNLTYEHVPPVVQHWIEEGHNQTAAEREAWYNNTDDMEAMGRSENSSGGGQETRRYAHATPGPRHPCNLDH
ncbi:type IV secretion protein Rhs [Lentzea sp. NEAU-D13]|uniref:Type IV secretion protein Rhs n=1 Tax=Lentzea alba TaxID=2714351 RepID=A0A7C9W799_9PSEU|nr:RHS repeat-associated core domain-containing protein [Lentzea alba]NGY65997.1 type IV secretion protein Rhs [Lentzea alba]